MTTAHVFIASSLDGFIARNDGDIDWLVQRDDQAEDHGYLAFMADKDVIVMGRATCEKAMTFDPWPFAVPVVVMSATLDERAVPERLSGKLRITSKAPEQVMAELAEQGLSRAYVDGGRLVQSFLRERLVADMVITTVPVLIGSGRRLFGDLPRDIDLKLLASRSFPSGLVQSTYEVVR